MTYFKIMMDNSKTLVDSNGRDLVTNLCKSLSRYARVILLLGEPGYGKSAYLDEAEIKQKRVYVVRVYKSWTMLRIFTTLLQKLSPRSSLSTNDIYEIIQSISSVINKMKNIPVIVIDEAGKFPRNGFAHLQELLDYTKGRASYIISGPPYVERNIQKAIKADYSSLKEFRRRINEVIALPSPEPHELAAICELEGITDLKWIEEKVVQCQTFSDIENEIGTYKLERLAEKNGFRPLSASK
jgi:Cdc6-like AAA superfamily ATPase